MTGFVDVECGLEAAESCADYDSVVHCKQVELLMILQTKTFGVWEYLLYEGYWGLLDVFDIKLIDAAVIFLE